MECNAADDSWASSRVAAYDTKNRRTVVEEGGREAQRGGIVRERTTECALEAEDLNDVHRLLVVFVALSAAFCASSMLLLNTIRGAWRANDASELWGNGRGSWGSHWRTELRNKHTCVTRM